MRSRLALNFEKERRVQIARNTRVMRAALEAEDGEPTADPGGLTVARPPDPAGQKAAYGGLKIL